MVGLVCFFFSFLIETIAGECVAFLGDIGDKWMIFASRGGKYTGSL